MSFFQSHRWLFTSLALAATVASTAFAQDDDDDDEGPPPQGYVQTYGPGDPSAGYDNGYNSGYAQPPGAYGDDGMASPAPEFTNALSPYGEWISVPGYGTVWRPYSQVVGVDFRPYATGGHWVYTDYGWSFQSDYPFAWAAFHYGRWLLEPGDGWVWVPGRVWAPAWVNWRFGGGYVGWFPLAPAGVDIDLEGYQTYWCFVPTTSFVTTNVYTALIPPAYVHQAFAVTSVVDQRVAFNGVRFNVGPPPVRIAAAIGRPVRPIALRPPMPGTIQQVRLVSQPGRRPAFVASPVRPGPAMRAAPGLPNRPGLNSRPFPGRPEANSLEPRGNMAPAPGYRDPGRSPYPARTHAAPHDQVRPMNTPWFQGRPMAPSYQARPMAPSYQARPTAPSYQARPMAPSYQARPTAPSYQARPTAPSYQARPMAPSYQARPTAPSYQARPTAPSYQARPMAPSYQARSFGPAPRPSPQAMAPRAPAPYRASPRGRW